MTTVNQVMSYIRTFTGRLVDPIHLTPEDICIEDIAHALSNQCRFSGHTRRFYSVAEHSVRVSKRCTLDPLSALLHDAPEAYLVDLPRPLKHHPQFAFYRLVEAHVEEMIQEKFALIPLPEIEEEIKVADQRMLASEMFGLMNRQDAPLPFPPYPELENVRLGMSPEEAERWFLGNFYAEI
jgi:uncharacterized protein